MKVSIIGAGNVGSTLAARILECDLADVTLVDIAGNLARGKALDLMHCAPILGFHSTCYGTDDYSLIANSDVVVITAGLARKPGMSREDLIKKNLDIIKEVSMNIKKFCPKTIILVVTNPLDIMTYAVLKITGFKREKVIGMAGLLDSARFSVNIAKSLDVPVRSVRALVMGIHSDEMLTIISHTSVSDANIKQLVTDEQLNGIVHKTKTAGGEIVSLLGSGSAYFAPSAAAFYMVESVLKNIKRTLPASVYLEGEYGLSDVCIGVPIEIDATGIRKIIEVNLTKEEQRALTESAVSLKQKFSQVIF